jgi:hypothetical protein
MPTLLLTKVPKRYNGEKTASSTSVAEKTGYLPAENCNWIHVYHPVQVHSKWIKDLNIRPETVKIV